MTRTRLAVILAVTLTVGWVLGARATTTIAAYRETQARVGYLWAAFGPSIMHRVAQEQAKREQAGPPQAQPEAPQSTEPPKDDTQ